MKSLLLRPNGILPSAGATMFASSIVAASVSSRAIGAPSRASATSQRSVSAANRKSSRSLRPAHSRGVAPASLMRLLSQSSCRRELGFRKTDYAAPACACAPCAHSAQGKDFLFYLFPFAGRFSAALRSDARLSNTLPNHAARRERPLLFVFVQAGKSFGREAAHWAGRQQCQPARPINRNRRCSSPRWE
jgi:hypothetical protein